MTSEACRGCSGVCPAMPTREGQGCPRPRLLPSNVSVVEAYLDCVTQWRLRDAGVRTGLDYAGVRAAIEVMHPHGEVPALFSGIRVIERAVLRAQAEWLAVQSVASREDADG